MTTHLTPYTKNGVSHCAFFHVLLSQRANVHTVNSQSTAQLTVKAPKISVVNSQTSQNSWSKFWTAVTAVTREYVGVTSTDLVQQRWQYSVIQVVYQNTRLQLIQCKCSLCDLISIKLIYIRIHNCFHNLPTGTITGLLRFDDTRSSAMLTCTVKLWLQTSTILEGCSGQFRWTVKDWLRLSWWYCELHVHSIGTISSPPAEYEAFAQNCRLVWLLMLLTWWRSKKKCLWVATVM